VPTLGLIVNPIAGMGGRVALKGTDGAETLREALARGAEPVAPRRAAEALAQRAPLASGLELLVWSEEMGAREVRAAGLACRVLHPEAHGATSASDTKAAAAEMVGRGAQLLLFAGGDGTACDVLEAIDTRAPALGIPAGVKMHSAVFAVSPKGAGQVARGFLASDRARLRSAEVMDVDEDLLRRGVVAPRLHGELQVPVEARLLQSAKARLDADDDAMLAGIAAHVAEGLDDDVLAIVGPGTTTAAILRRLGVEEPTLLGIDVVRNGHVVAQDADERTLLRLLEDPPCARVIVAPVGGQGFLLGRGNQQLSPAVLRRVGGDALVVVATESKLAALRGRPLLVDTGDAELDRRLAGHVRVVVDRRRFVVYRVKAC